MLPSKRINFSFIHFGLFQVNGIKVRPGVQYATFRIENEGKFVTFKADFGLIAKFDGNSYAYVDVPVSYKSQLQGICGDCDGNKKNDFMTKEGKDVSKERAKYLLVGNSYQVNDPSDPK